MGKKKEQTENLGRSIIKSRFAKTRINPNKNTFLHTTELPDGYDWGRLNLTSITEQSDLADFLSTAEMAGTEFIAEKMNVMVVNPSVESGLLGADVLREVTASHELHRDKLRVPRRPEWDKSTSKEELDILERESFVQWRRDLAHLQEEHSLILTPYEKNLEFWRQFWRVIEKSDLIVQIVDARNPLLFYCDDLIKYVKEIDPRKDSLVLINKADFLNTQQRHYWIQYFTSCGVRAVFWSARKSAEDSKADLKNDGTDSDDSSSDVERNEDSSDEDCDDRSDEGTDDPDDVYKDSVWDETEQSASNKVTDEIENSRGLEADNKRYSAVTPTESSAMGSTSASAENESRDDTRIHGNSSTDEGGEKYAQKTETNVDSLVPGPDNDRSCYDETDERLQSTSCRLDHPGVNDPRRAVGDSSGDTLNVEQGLGDSSGDTLIVEHGLGDMTSDILNVEQLLNVFRVMCAGLRDDPEAVTTVGMVGYPNVGKSSTINAILDTKKVPVSATPGRTKHFQTLFVDDDLMLCDCPGLVFPSFVTTKAELVVSGILPIDQMREHVPPVALVCERIPRAVLCSVYGIMLPAPSDTEDSTRPPTAHEFLASYALMRGFMTHKGLPDGPRASRHVLKDYVNGKLVYCHPPPQVDADTYQPTATCLAYLQTCNKPMRSEKSCTDKPWSDVQGKVDQEFFHERSRLVHLMGVRNQSSGVAPLFVGKQKVSDKPWKQKVKTSHKKREKLRRVYRDQDVH